MSPARPVPAHPRSNDTNLERRHGGGGDGATAAAAGNEELELAAWHRGEEAARVARRAAAEGRQQQRHGDGAVDERQHRGPESLPELEPVLSAMSAADRARGPVARAWLRHVSVKVPRAKMRDHLGGFFSIGFPSFLGW